MDNLRISYILDASKLTNKAAREIQAAMDHTRDVIEKSGAKLSVSDVWQKELRKYDRQLENITKKRDALLAEMAQGAPQLLPGLDNVPAQAAQASKSFNMLGMSVQQVMRELPAFSYNIGTGFLAISNNLPMLSDAIQQIRRENEALAAAGQKTVPVWRQVAKSFLSWNTAMSVGITLLTVYGPKIAEAVSKLQLFQKALDPAVEAKKQWNEAVKKGTEEAQKEIVQLKVLYDAATDDTRSRTERLSAVDQLQDAYPAYFKNLSDESIMAGQAADAYARLTKSLTDAAIARASMDKMTQNATRLLDLTSQRDKLESQLKSLQKLRDSMGSNASMLPFYGQTDSRVRSVESQLKGVISEINALNAANEKLASGINISSLVDGGKGSSGKEINTNLSTLGGLTNKINELREAQSKASAEQAINLEKEIQLYQQRLDLLNQTIAKGAAGRLGDTNYKEELQAPAIEGLPAVAPVSIPVQFDVRRLQENMQVLKQQFSDAIKEMTVFSGEQLTGLVTQAFAGMGEAIVSGNALEALKSVLMMIMDMLQQFGSTLIAAGMASEALKAVAWSGIGAIIAGGALVAATAAAKAALNKATAFANGGIVSGPTYALVGEYAGARSNPEVIAPLDKLRSMIEPARPSLEGLYLETKIRGKDLYVALQSIEHERRRTR